MRVVIDTNVLISAYAFPGGPPEEVFRSAIEGRIELGTSRALLAEFGRVLEDKFGWAPDRVTAAVSQLARVATIVEPAEPLSVIAADPDDDRVLEAAAAFDAALIISGGRHLLDLGAWHGIEILSPAQFVRRYSG